MLALNLTETLKAAATSLFEQLFHSWPLSSTTPVLSPADSDSTFWMKKYSRWLSCNNTTFRRASWERMVKVHFRLAGLLDRMTCSPVSTSSWTPASLGEKKPVQSSVLLQSNWSFWRKDRPMRSWSLARFSTTFSCRIFQRSNHSLNSLMPWASTQWAPTKQFIVSACYVL